MPRLEVWLPVKPFHLNQKFGDNIPCVADTPDVPLAQRPIVNGVDNNTCPAGYVKLYPLLGYPDGHNGNDLMAGEQPCYSAHAGTVIEIQTVPARGIGVGVLTDEPVDLDASGTHHIKIRNWHFKSVAVQVGQKVSVGDVLGITDNTGFSSGDHLHWEGDPMDLVNGQWQLAFPNNGFQGSIDLMPFWNMRFAEDYELAEKTLAAAANIVKNPSVDPSLRIKIGLAAVQLIQWIFQL
jgi:murein DD-endopeptidase MepM/ murein hydrolase activator NlpD